MKNKLKTVIETAPPRRFKLVQINSLPPHQVLLEFFRDTTEAAVAHAKRVVYMSRSEGEIELWETVNRRDSVVERIRR